MRLAPDLALFLTACFALTTLRKRFVAMMDSPIDRLTGIMWDANLACKCLGKCPVSRFEDLAILEQCRCFLVAMFFCSVGFFFFFFFPFVTAIVDVAALSRYGIEEEKQMQYLFQNEKVLRPSLDGLYLG